MEEKGNEIKRQEEDKKQLILKLCNTQKQTESHEQKLKKVEGEHEKAIKAIQGFMEYEQEIQNANSQKDQRILELETELRKLRDSNDSVKPRNNGLVSLKDLDVRNVDNSESDSCKQVNIIIYHGFSSLISTFQNYMRFLFFLFLFIELLWERRVEYKISI